MECDTDVITLSDNGRLEEKNEMLNKTIRDMSLWKYNLWCSKYQEEGNTKDLCKHETIWVIQMEHFYEIYWEITPHLTKDCPYNLRNQNKSWCAIWEESSHNTTNCDLNAKKHPTYPTIYKIEVVQNDQSLSNSYRGNGYNQHRGYNGRGRSNGQGGFSGQCQYNNNSGKIKKWWIF